MSSPDFLNPPATRNDYPSGGSGYTRPCSTTGELEGIFSPIISEENQRKIGEVLDSAKVTLNKVNVLLDKAGINLDNLDTIDILIIKNIIDQTSALLADLRRFVGKFSS